MRFRFNEKKATQAAVHLLKQKGGTLDKLVLMKTLYMAERRTFLENGKPITGDIFKSMDHGPVLSQVFHLIKEPFRGTTWPKFVDAPDAEDKVHLKAGAENADNDELSRYELRVLDEELVKWGHYEAFPLADKLHGICPEWRRPHTAVSDIEYVDLLRKNGKTEAEIKSIERDAELAYAHAMLGQ